MEAKDESVFLSPVLERQGCDKEIRLVTYFNCKSETIFYPKILVAKQLPTLAKELFRKKKHIFRRKREDLTELIVFFHFTVLFCYLSLSFFCW